MMGSRLLKEQGVQAAGLSSRPTGRSGRTPAPDER